MIAPTPNCTIWRGERGWEMQYATGPESWRFTLLDGVPDRPTYEALRAAALEIHEASGVFRVEGHPSGDGRPEIAPPMDLRAAWSDIPDRISQMRVDPDDPLQRGR